MWDFDTRQAASGHPTLEARMARQPVEDAGWNAYATRVHSGLVPHLRRGGTNENSPSSNRGLHTNITSLSIKRPISLSPDN